MTLKELKTEFENLDKIKIFEVEVIDKRTGEKDYIVFNIKIIGRSFVAQHVAMNAKQEKSKKIAFCKVLIDTDFSLDNNLQELYSECINVILNSEYFELSENS